MNNNNPKTTTRTYPKQYSSRKNLRKKHNQRKFVFFVILAVLLLALIVAISFVIADLVRGTEAGETTTGDATSDPGILPEHGMLQAYDGDRTTYMLSITKQSVGSYFSCEFATPADVATIILVSSEPEYYIRSADVQLKVDGRWVTVGTFDAIGESSFSTASASYLASAVRILLTANEDAFWAINELSLTDKAGNAIELRSPSAGNNSSSGDTDNTTDENTTEGGQTTETDPPATNTITVNNDRLYTGSLILVNAQYAYRFPSSTANLLNLYDEYFANDYHCNYFEGSNIRLEAEATRNIFAMLNAMYSETGLNKIILGSGYRTYEEQQQIAVDFPDTAALPGFSEHHTALGIDMKGWIGGKYYNLDDSHPDTTAMYSWLKANAYKYGYVRRFAPDKDVYTGVTTDRWHYRYVGVPHAYYMSTNNLCLEEYLAALESNCRYGTNHLILENVDGVSYEIYFVPASDGETTEIPVPADPSTYTISGNNYSGYIVTITRN
ncbi:MAG: D-alanyl-D-alanine carboxypeptidase family protein [Eubacteriales bacterium]